MKKKKTISKSNSAFEIEFNFDLDGKCSMVLTSSNESRENYLLTQLLDFTIDSKLPKISKKLPKLDINSLLETTMLD